VHSLEQHAEPATLTSLVARIALIEQVHRQELEARDLQIKLLTEQVRLLRAQRFGASSEQHSPDQLTLLLNEAESLAAGTLTAPISIVIPTHTRPARGHRKPLSADLPRVEVIHDLPECEKVCAYDGAILKVIGHDPAEQLD